MNTYFTTIKTKNDELFKNSLRQNAQCTYTRKDNQRVTGSLDFFEMASSTEVKFTHAQYLKMSKRKYFGEEIFDLSHP